MASLEKEKARDHRQQEIVQTLQGEKNTRPGVPLRGLGEAGQALKKREERGSQGWVQKRGRGQTPAREGPEMGSSSPDQLRGMATVLTHSLSLPRGDQGIEAEAELIPGSGNKVRTQTPQPHPLYPTPPPSLQPNPMTQDPLGFRFPLLWGQSFIPSQSPNHR